MSEMTGKELGLTVLRGRPLKVKEVAAAMRRSERGVHYLMDKGDFPIRYFITGERGRIVDSADLDDWLRSTVVEASPKIKRV